MKLRDKEVIVKEAKKALFGIADNGVLASYYIDELARFLVYGCDSNEDFFSLYEEMMSEILPSGGLTCAEHSLIAELCRGICRYSAEKGRRIGLSDFFESDEALGTRIVYVKNAISDEAYRKFEAVIKNATVEYLPSFASACEEVYYGRSPYCILPYENSEEGTLAGFMRLINKYELYPHFVCSCGGEGGVTHLALLGRAPSVREENLEMRVRVSLSLLDGVTLAKVVTAASTLGIKLIKTESVPLRWNEGRYGETLTFSADTEGAVPFLIYLSLAAPECSDKAIYYKI